MLSTLLGSLASFFSKFFIVASWLPVLVFSFSHGLMAFLLFDAFHDWTLDFLEHQTLSRYAFVTAALVIGTLVAAYVLSSLNDFLRGLLEGRWPEAIRRLSTSGQALRLERLRARFEDATRVQIDLSDDATAIWLNLLFDARIAGQSKQDNTFSGSDPSVSKIRALKRHHVLGRLIDSRDLQAAVDALAPQLRAHNAEKRDTPAQRLLSELHEALVIVIQSAADRARNELLRVNNQLTSSFGTADVAPTAMGNIANTAQVYGVRRYDCNFELFWNTLQRVVQKDETAYTALQESKAQLDFLVACCWLTTVWWMTWVAILGLWGDSVLWFVAFTFFGPAATYLWYRAATEYYRSFVDVLTTSLDLFRIDLLRSLGFNAPADVVDERVLWDHLHQIASFSDQQVNLRYQAFKATP